ncbi:TPA: ribonuclease J [Clostridium botulinum]|uniref:ribonuclease J n=1 Tax=Clostridium TaxID=1485 RepID=UPI00077433A8|nr:MULTISPECIES: ribonuclease J [Clostridium]AUM95183.1 ribonuclease J [Clostridium sporogenes]AVQ52626.1 ribonuclease J [Clostridium botulinum]MBO0526328.1 ribonuclease J [Clostridium botulinum]MBO0527291.1 ribonuclease J [Clostridium botulinum]MBO0531484.1 ribonuclease J [Clostridium botulinum]
MSNKDSIKIIPLGGLGEIGKNITAFEYENEIVIIDCGISFPDEEMYGVDLVIPDITYLLNNKDKVKAIFLTHGHEDHIGSLPYILQQLNRPVYGTALTLGIVENKLREHNMLSDCELNKVEAGDIVELKNLKVEFIRNTHSIADSCSIAIHTPVGVILHTGDFKIDYTPIDGLVMDFHRIAELGKKGVLLLMADSTNVQRKGHTISEKSIGETLTKIFSNAKGRVIVATFASNIHRMQQIVDASIEYGRKVAFSGRSMENISKVAMDLGYLHIPETYLITVDEMKNYPNEQITIITTGSQGEPMAALARIAYSNHRKIAIEPKDLFIISASPIPGNEKLISRVINELFKKGADVIYEALEEVHVSGHAYEEELKLIHTLVHPKYFMPVHGEYRHLKRHVDLAMELGMERENIFSLETGQVLEISHEEAKVSGKVRTGSIFVDGIGVGDVGNIVLRDRRYLAQDGMLTIVVTLEKESYSVIAGPDVITRGFIYVKESEALINEVKEIVKEELENCLENKIIEWYVLKSNIKKSVEKYLYEKTKRRPIVLPIIMEI